MKIKRLIILLMLLLVAGAANAQKVQLDSIRWINKDLGHLYFEGGHVYFNFLGSAKQRMQYSIVKNILVMTDVYTSSKDNFKVKHRIDAKFLIRNLTASRLYIKAIDSNAVKLAGSETYLFTNFKNSYDKDIKFAKVRFLSSTCHGDCPQLSVEIWANGNYYFKGGEYAEPFKGEFIGRLTAIQQDSLNYLLKHSELKKMYNWEQDDKVTDKPNYYFEIDFVDSKKQLSITTNQPPLNITDLIQFMLASYKNVLLAPVK